MTFNSFMRAPYRAALLAAVLPLFAFSAQRAAAEDVKIGFIKVTALAPVMVAQAKGYFAAEGLNAEIVPFDAPVPVAQAVVSGAVDFGTTGPSGAFYNLASQGGGLRFLAVLASNRAYNAGLTSVKALAGHSVAVSDIGGAAHYSLTLIEEKYHIDPASVRVTPLQGISAAISALAGGSVDASSSPSTAFAPVIARGDAKLLAYVGDETPWQAGIVYTTKKTADERRATVEKVLRALKNAMRDYHDAFTGPDERRKDGPTAPEMLAILSKQLGQPPEQIARAIAYVDRDGRVDVKDLHHQVTFLRAQGLIKGNVDLDAIVDKRYVVPLP